MSNELSLGNIRDILRRYEDDIIFRLKQRAEFGYSGYSFEDLQAYSFEQNETSQNYTSLKVPLIKDLSSLSWHNCGWDIHKTSLNKNSQLLQSYFNLIPNYCSNVNLNQEEEIYNDERLLELLSQRVQIGLLVAQSKYLEQKGEYDKLIVERDRKGIETLLRNISVEQANVQRVIEKASGKKFHNPQFVGTLYENLLMPLTVELEVDYFMEKLGENGQICEPAYPKNV